MNRTVRCLAIFAIGVGAWACQGDPQSSLNRGDITEVRADPASILVDAGATTSVLVDARDDLNQAVEITSATTTAGSGITVVRDFLFQPVFDAGATDSLTCVAIANAEWTGAGCLVPRSAPTRLRYEVTGTALTVTSFQVTINGTNSIVIPVTVTVPTTITGSLSNLTPASGEDVTLTLPVGSEFNSTVVADPTMWQIVTIGATSAVVSNLTATVATFQFTPNVSGPVAADSVFLPANLSVPALTVTTAEVFTSPQIPAPYAITLSSNSVTGFDLVTATAGAGILFAQTSLLFVGNAGVGCPADPSCVPVSIQSRAADGSTIDGLYPQDKMGTVYVSAMFATATPQFATLTGESNQTITIAATTVPVTVTQGLPPSGIGLEVVRLTLAGAGFSFAPTAAVTGVSGGIESMAVGVDPGGTWVDYVPEGGSTGTPTVAGILFGGFSFEFPADNFATVPASTITGTNTDPGPTIALPPSGNTLTFYDTADYTGTGLPAFGGFPGNFYNVSPAASATFVYTLSWSDGFTADLGAYWMDPGGTVFICVADGFGGQTGGSETTGTCVVPGGINTVNHMITFDTEPAIIRQQFDVQ